MNLLVLILIQLCTVNGDVFRFRMPEEVPINTVIADLPRLLNVPSMDEQNSAEFRFQILSSNPIYHQLFSIEQLTGILRTSGQIDRDQLCQRAELCCTMSRHDFTESRDIKEVGMESLRTSLRKRDLFQGQKCQLDLRIAVNSMAPASVTTFATIQIELIDINDNVPQFSSLQNNPMTRNYDGSLMFTISIPESAPTGQQLPLPLAIDADAGQFGVQGYRLEEPSARFRPQMDSSMDHRFPFRLIPTHRDDGVILPKLELIEQLDFESRQTFFRTLIAYDGDRQSENTAELLLRINVIDENDNEPEVTVRTPHHSSLETLHTVSGKNQISVREDCAVGTLLANFEARDADNGENGRVTFSWGETTPPQIRKLFKLNPVSGELRLADRLDYDGPAKSFPRRSVDSYNLVVVASDEGRSRKLSTSASIAIQVVDVNDEEPRITIMDLGNRSPAQLEVWENEPRDKFVALVTVEDLDGVTGPNGQFICTLNSSLFQLIATEAYMGHGTGSLVVHNEFGLADMGEGGGHHPVAGAGRAEFQLITATSFDREQSPIHYVAIRCRDNGSPALESQTAFAVNVLDHNDNPPHFTINPMTVTVPEDAPVGSLIVTLNATDPDRPDDPQSVTYSLVSVTALSSMHPVFPVNSTQFRLEVNTGRLILVEPLDRELKQEYQVTVRATDRGHPQQQTCELALRVQVLDTNDNPPLFGNPSGYRFAIEEEKKPGAVVGIVSATDADEGESGKVSYRLFGSAAAVQRTFTVDSNTGEITTKASLDREVNAFYEFFVTAEDSSPSKRLTSTTKVVVEILDINDNDPKFIYPTQPNHTIHASAYSKVGAAIVKLTVFDADAAGEQGLFFFIKNTTSQGLFALNPSSGELSFAREILDEDVRSHQLEIEARDSGIPPRTSVTYITVVIDTRAHQRGVGSNKAMDYPNSANYAKSWASRDEGGAFSLFESERSGADIYARQDGGPSPIIDRRLILICCLAFLGCLLLVIFGAILIRFKRRRAPEGENATAGASNQTKFVHSKDAKYRAATLQPQSATVVTSPLPLTSKDTSRYVYGWSAQRSPVIAAGYATAAGTQLLVSNQNQKMLPAPQHHKQQEQLLRMGYVTNAPGGVNFDAGVMQIQHSQGEFASQTKNRSNSLGDSLDEYERPPLLTNEHPNLYLSQGRINCPGMTWKHPTDGGICHYGGPMEGGGYYNKLSGGGNATSGVILQPSAYMQGSATAGGPFYGGGEEEEDCEECSGRPEPVVFLATTKSQTTDPSIVAMNVAYQTLNSLSTDLERSQQAKNSFLLDNRNDVDGQNSEFDLVGEASAVQVTSHAWRRNPSKKGIISSSFV